MLSLLAVALSPSLGKLGEDPRAFHQPLKEAEAKAAVTGEARSLAEAALRDRRGRMWLPSTPGHGTAPLLPCWEL